MIGELDAGKPPVQFDEGVQETCDTAARLRPTLPEPQFRDAALPYFSPSPPTDSATEPFFLLRAPDRWNPE